MGDTLPDYLPLSFLNQLSYCPRRFWLMYAQSEIEINAPMLEGTIRHQRAHDPGSQRLDDQGRALRSVHVWSDVLRVAGIADFVEITGTQTELHLLPVEHKHGRMGKWLNDHIQLCAQAMCLEERTGIAVPVGEIFYWSNRRREQVTFDDALRQRTQDAIQYAFALLAMGQTPAPIEHKAKCRDCSMEPICLPDETLALLRDEAVEGN
ncbi:MAG: CRISPR-associated protein Cas4 [Anaerolineae bacterium]|nr:CRISPR-associated protein Cas4 [Anaerolineae bacterium]